MKKIELIRNILLDELKSGTKAEIVILIFSELNEEGEIIKCVDFRYVSNIIGRTSYYEGVRKLKEKGIIPKTESIVSNSDISVSENEQKQIMSENEQNVSVSENEQNITVSKSNIDISKSEQNIDISENEQIVSENEQRQPVPENEQVSKITKEKNISEPKEEKKTPTMEELLALF